MADSNFYAERISGSGVFAGRTLIQASGSIGGHRYVFVKLIKGSKDGLVYPTTGGKLLNPFKGPAKIFAGDLVEYDPGIVGSEGATVKILKSYELAADASTTEISLINDGYHHIPFVGDNIMVSPDTLEGTGTGVTVLSVAKSVLNGVNVFNVTLSGAITASKGTVLVEASAAGAGVKAMVTNPNAYAPCDFDFIYTPASDLDEFDGARYMFTPCLANGDTVLYVDRMSPVPPAVKAINKSRVQGWFWFE